MSEFIQYWLEVFRIACSGAWVIAQSLSFIITIILGIIVWKHPKWESKMKHLCWMIPLGIFCLLLIIRLATVPYVMDKEKTEKITNLESVQEEKKRDLKQDIRTCLESINPEILQRIDEGRKEILVCISSKDVVEITNLSKCMGFDNYLSFRQATLGDDFDGLDDPNVYIENYKYQWVNNGYYFYPKDALVR